MQITHLDGTPALSVTEGQEYLVPCVFGIPVVMPSHVDEGNEGPTGRHWHTDDRFGSVAREYEYWSEGTLVEIKAYEGDSIRSDILRDGDQPVVLEQMTAHKTDIRPSGGVFTSIAWLYHTLGDQHSKDGRCVHHATPLVKQEGCLVCPAHALKYKDDGSPRYQGPFFIRLDYTDWDKVSRRIRMPLCFGPESMEFKVNGYFDHHPLLTLEDSTGEVITQNTDWDADPVKSGTGPNGSSSVTLTLGAWPSSGTCPSLVHKDPRE